MNDISFKTPEELQIDLGERLRRLRLFRNIDQRETAGKAGISEKALLMVEVCLRNRPIAPDRVAFALQAALS